MYEIIKNVIDSKNYELVSMLEKIDTIWVQGSINDEQRNSLIELARQNAIPENSYASLEKTIAELVSAVDDLKQRVTSLEQPVEGETPVPEEYPEFIAPTGAHDAYKIGDKVTFETQKYECILDGCVWSPKDYPQGWKLAVTEVPVTE